MEKLHITILVSGWHYCKISVGNLDCHVIFVIIIYWLEVTLNETYSQRIWELHWQLQRFFWQQWLVESSINGASDWHREYGETGSLSLHTRFHAAGYISSPLLWQNGCHFPLKSPHSCSNAHSSTFLNWCSHICTYAAMFGQSWWVCTKVYRQ